MQDESIRDIVAFQESLGLPSITDGEFRRRSWSAGFIDAVEGFGLRDGTLGFRNESRSSASPLRRTRRRRSSASSASSPTTIAFLKSVVKRGVPKVTIAAPDVMHYFLGPKAFDAYIRDREAFFADLVKIYRDEIADLAAGGLHLPAARRHRAALQLRCARARGRGGARRGRRRAHASATRG